MPRSRHDQPAFGPGRYDLLFDEARESNERIRDLFPEDYIEDLEERIARIAARL